MRAVSALALVLAACAGRAAPAAVAPAPANVVAAPEPAPPPPIEAPAGYVEVHVAQVVRTPDGQYGVLLVPEGTQLVMPVWVADTEGTSIAYRFAGEPYERPLTHDLLDSIVERLGAEVVKVHIDSIQGNTYHGSVHLRRGDRLHAFDSRASDATMPR